ncbi:MAG: hypothetical protein COA96_04535 [SAR86 cluster bacterium]|uniref:FHA domain-containing protein n=1 Tax=SAR86 cluster bacterium TaxID=2030880 RepID=A0A2A5B6G8_9GAMM|nr:MAG: hypothetical protein COA96_04535 [SAR86 cluster bacterium]
MAKVNAYSIGRSKEADIQLNDPTVSRVHAELVITPSGKYYLTDCGSSGGTYTLQGNEKAAIKQSYVEQSDNLSFGEYHTTVQQLVAMIDDPTGFGNSDHGKKGKKVAPSPQDDLPEGPVKRNPASGEIIGE